MRQLLLFSSLVSLTIASYCGQAAVPFTFQVLRSGLPVLGCARPRCFGWNANGTRAGDTAQFYRINGKEDGYLRRSDQTKRAPYQNPEYEAQTSFCQPDYISASCSKNEWVGGIQPQAEASNGMKLRCCSYDPLTVSEDRGVANVTKGQLVVGGEVFQAKTLVGFDYISNVERYILEDGTVRYSVSVRRMDCIDDDSLYGGAAPIDTEVVAAQTTEEARTVPPTPAPTAPPPTRPRTVQTPPPETPAPETAGPVAPPREFAAPSEAYEQRAPLASYTGFGSAPGHEQHPAAPPGYQSQTTSPQHHNEFQPQVNNQQRQPHQSYQNQYNGQQQQYNNQQANNNQQQYSNNQQNYGSNQQNYGSNQQGYGNNQQGYGNEQQGYGNQPQHQQNQQQSQQNQQQSQQNQPQQPQQPLDAVLNLLGLPALPTLIPPAPQQPVTPSPFNMPPGMQQQSSQQYQQPQQGQYQQQQGQRFQNQQQYPQQMQQNQGQYNQNQQNQPQYSQNQQNQQQIGQNQQQYGQNQQNQPQYSSNQQNQPQYSSNQQPQQYQGPIVQNHIVQGVQQLNPPLQPLAPAPQGQFYSPIPQQNQQNQLQPLPTLPPLKLPTLDDLPKVEIPDVDDVEAVIPPMPRLILNQVAKFFGVL